MRERPRSQVLRVLIAIAICALLILRPRSGAANMPDEPIRVLRDTRQALLIAFDLPAYTLQQVQAQGQTFVQVAVAGLPSTAEPGMPQLPQASALIGLPPTGELRSRIVKSERETVSLEHAIYPAPAPIPIYTTPGDRGVDGRPARETQPLPTGTAYEFTIDKATYASEAFYPADVVDVAEIGWVRDQRVARVRFHPFRYHPHRGELEVTQRLELEIRFEGQRQAVTSEPTGAPHAAFERILDEALLNASTAHGWRTGTVETVAVSAQNVPATQAGSYKVTVNADGLYRLTYADLQNAGMPVGIGGLDPRTLQFFEGGEQVAIQVSGQDDGVLNVEDSLLFYGRVPRSRYTDYNVYWLRYGDEIGLRVQERSAAPGSEAAGSLWATARYEKNLSYDSRVRAADGDHWYAAQLLPGTDHTASIGLMPLDTGVPTATLRAWLASYTRDGSVAPDHHAVVVLNGHPVGGSGLWWDDVKAVTGTWTLDRAILVGNNAVTIGLPGDTGASVEGVWLDAIELRYPLQSVVGDQATFSGQAGAHRYDLSGFTNGDIWLYDVTDPRHPVQLAGQVTGGSGYTLSFADAPAHAATYMALTGARAHRPLAIVADTPSNLHDATNGADYVIITHADFVPAVQPLAAHRRAGGMRVSVVDVQDVYDEFSGGLLRPEAIRDFIAYAYTYWMPPRLAYVLLVGDGSYDFLDHYGYGSANYIPPFLDIVDDELGETAVDNRYAAILGNDSLPDVFLGRLPVMTGDQATTVVGKILQYEQSPWLGDWNAHHVFIADDLDPAGDFDETFDVVYNTYIHDPWIGDKIYMDNLTVAAARQEILAAWQRGALLMSFAGHSSWHQWAVEVLLHVDDVADFHNDRKWPVVLSMTCFTGFFHHPEYGTLDESLLRLQGGGAVATWSPSGMGVAAGHDNLYKHLYQTIFTQGQTQLGPATLYAKLNIATTYPDLLETYHLFGDPAMALNLTIRPWPHSSYMPVIIKHH